MNHHTRKKVVAVICILVTALGLVSCAETPEESIVIDKSGGLGKGSIIPEENEVPKDLQIPARWQETVERSDGFVTLEADYEIAIPKIYNTPVYSYEMKVMTNEIMEELCGYFSKGDKLYEYPKMTKSELNTEKEKLVNYKGRWASWDKTLSSTPYWKGMIETIDELIEKAPEKTEKYNYIDVRFMPPYQTALQVLCFLKGRLLMKLT